MRNAVAGGLRGVCLFPAMHHFHAWEERCYPVYEAAQSAGAVVFIHFGLLKIGVRDKLGLPSRFDMRFSNPIDLHRVAKDFPTMTFVMPHFGCGFLREALIVWDQCLNVYVDTFSSNPWVNTMPPRSASWTCFGRRSGWSESSASSSAPTRLSSPGDGGGTSSMRRCRRSRPWR